MESQVHFLGSELEPLSFNKMLEITSQSYTDKEWCKLAYSVSKSGLQSYTNEQMTKIVNHKKSDGSWNFNDKVVNCLFYETSLRHPGVSAWTKEFKFFTGLGSRFLGAVGVNTIHLEADVSEGMMLRRVGDLVQYTLLSESPFNRLLIALHKPNCDDWELVYAEAIINPYVNRSRPVNISYFSRPSEFFKALLSGEKLNSVEHKRYEVRVRVRN